MWNYEKKLQYPIKISKPNPKYAKIIITQYGGPDGELGASMRYLSQRYTMPYREVVGILNDIGTEELAHLEMVSSIVYQLLRNATTKEIEEGGFSDYFVDHTTGIWPQSAGGVPFNALTFQSKGDVITDLTEDMAAEGTTLKEQPDITTSEKACDLIRTTNHKNTIGQAVFKENKLSRDYHITVKGKQSRGIFVMLKIRE